MARLRAKRVRALLGPTNTGKTHRAIEAMLRHKSGMFGLPLRLLAREVYDRVTAATSPDQVALITGEEKRVPDAPRYWICTVEAMPVDQRVAFVGIDEVQLAADRQRGHVFTDRILHCRGLVETVFMGSDRITALLTELVPEVEIERAPRFSQLTMRGPHSVRSLPRRSAVVAFSADQVYGLAERLKAAHGGAAVVLGALSPRTRNAQVELYQSGRVKHLVATDAIGMGLNLDLHHVALAAVRKYDGRGFRDLSAAEVGQIAGRAGRYQTDGTFGALRPLELDPELVQAVEQHRFSPVKRVYWRNSNLQFDTAEALLTSLERRPHHPALRPLRNLDDEHALVVLARDPQIEQRVQGRGGVARLWEVCQVPDFRKTLTDAHLKLLRALALHLLGRGTLPDSWVADRIGRLDRTDGDIETLMSRIAWIRTWTYIAYRPDWIEDRSAWQERTRAIEDRLSDALHAALTARFVDPLRHTARRLEDVTIEGDSIQVGGVAVATLVGLEAVAEHGIPGGLSAAIRHVIEARLERLIEDGGLEIDEEHRITWQGSVLADLQPGPVLTQPKIRMRRLELLSGVAKNRLAGHLDQWVSATVGDLTRRLEPSKRHTPGVRGVLYQLRENLGSVARSDVVTALDSLDEQERRDLAKTGVRVGLHAVYLPASLKPAAQAVRARLWCVYNGISPTERAPSGTAAFRGDLPEAYWSAIGFHVVGDVAVRADVLEAAAADLRRRARKGPFVLPDGVVSRLALGTGAAHAFVTGLGYRHQNGRYRGAGRRGGRGR